MLVTANRNAKGVIMKNYSTTIIASFLLAGCSANGPPYSSVEQSLPAKQGMAELVIYRPSAFTGSMGTQEIDLNGSKLCSMPTASFITKYVDPGKATISAPKWSGTSDVSFTSQPGHKYFVRIDWDQSKLLGDVTGIIGQGIAEATSSHAGPYLIELIDEQTARGEVSSLKMVSGCQ
jgi:hypothetical protein